ncbi:MAG: vWA domain-containing protein [Acidobacteriota bacterium]
MGPVNELTGALRALFLEWSGLDTRTLQYPMADQARLAILAFGGLALLALIAVAAWRSQSRAGRVALPALLEWVQASRLALVRHGALLLALAGLPFFAVALADPMTAVVREEVTYPGHRISLMIDASSSMLTSMPGRTLAKDAPNDAAFFTTVGAARYFVEMRKKGGHRDLMALVEFGDQAYVITPFTTDYDNILLSIALIGDWNEFMAFPDQGTIIANAVQQSVALFRAFDFLDAAGNVMVMFSDGIDAEVTEDGRSILDVLRFAERAKVPVFFIRVGGKTDMPRAVSNEAWRSAIQRTGGRFFEAADEATVVRAIQEIDKMAPGRIELKQYSTEQPRYASFAFIAMALWAGAALLRLTVPVFQTFP